MINKEYVQLMAQYNIWQNDELLRALSNLDKAQLTQDIGLFFKSIFATMNHILWVDSLWVSRLMGDSSIIIPFADNKKLGECDIYDESTRITNDLHEFRTLRVHIDSIIIAFAGKTEDAWLHGNLRYMTTEGTPKDAPVGMAVCQLFNHQTHHRGQIHGALSRFGITGYTTDIPMMPNNL